MTNYLIVIAVFLKKLDFFQLLMCWGNFAYNKLSIICCARGLKALLAHSFSSSGKSESESLFRSTLGLCHLCFAVACDCGVTSFRLRTMMCSFVAGINGSKF